VSFHDFSLLNDITDKIPTVHEEYSEFKFACQQQIMRALGKRLFALLITQIAKNNSTDFSFSILS